MNVSQDEQRQGILGLVRERFRYGLVLRTVLRVLGSRGIEIIPYFVTQESLKEGIAPSLDQGLGPVVTCLLSPAEIDEILAHPEGKTMGSKETLLGERCFCFGLKLNGEVAACTWCNVHRCHSELDSFALKENEAYLCSAVTLMAHWGRNVAPLLRYELYRYLNQMGRTDFYSITEYFNAPARKFKEKLGARQLKLGLHIRLFSRWKRNITLRRYRT